MDVRTLVGQYDGTTEAAAMIDSTSGTAFGPLFEGFDAAEQIEAFQAWLRGLPFAADGAAAAIGLVFRELPRNGADGDDPRSWPDSGLVKLVAYWRANFLTEDGYLKDDVV